MFMLSSLYSAWSLSSCTPPSGFSCLVSLLTWSLSSRSSMLVVHDLYSAWSLSPHFISRFCCSGSLLNLTLSSCPPGPPGLVVHALVSIQPGFYSPEFDHQVSYSSSLLTMASVLLHFTSRLVVEALYSPLPPSSYTSPPG